MSDKIINIEQVKGTATVADAVRKAAEFIACNKVERAIIIMRFNSEEQKGESLGFFIGNNEKKKPFTNSLLAWDLEQVRFGIFNGDFEED